MDTVSGLFVEFQLSDRWSGRICGMVAFMLCAEVMQVAHRITVCVCVLLCVVVGFVVNLCGMKQNMEPDLESQQGTTGQTQRNRIAHRRK
jgi:hypothetical protein